MKKTYLIIGGSSGIGLAACRRLVEDGHRVLAASREARELASIPEVEHFTLDITEEAPAFPEVGDQLDGLLYCPGTINLRPFKSLKIKDFETDYAINVLGAVKTLQHYLKPLKKAEQASVVMFSTVAVQTGMPFHASVGAAKGAIEGLTRSLAAELAPKVRVNAIAPSLTDTPMAERLLSSEARAKASAERHPLQRVGTPDEMAAMACMLLSDQASWISGQVFQIDGGMSALRTNQ